MYVDLREEKAPIAIINTATKSCNCLKHPSHMFSGSKKMNNVQLTSAMQILVQINADHLFY
jgi:hypothetical protein